MELMHTAWSPCLLHVYLKGHTHLCRVVDILQSRVTGNHGSQIRERAQPIEPALSVICPGVLEKLDH